MNGDESMAQTSHDPSDARTTPAVSVVVPARNEAEHIGNLMESLFAQTHPSERLEIVLVDGASEDATIALASGAASRAGWAVRSPGDDDFRGRQLTVIDNPRRITPVAFNLGVAAARGEVIVIVGGHSMLDPEFVSAAVSALKETGAAVVGGHLQIVTSDESMTPLARAQQSRLGTGGAAYRTAGSERQQVDTVPFPAFEKDTWAAVGGFDEELIRNQDDEFILRVRQAGGTVVIDPAIKATYFARPSINSLRRQYYQYGWYRIVTIRKRGRPGSLRPLAPMAMVPVVLACLAAAALGRRRGLVPPTLYLIACSAEGIRLNPDRLSWAPRSVAAIVTMQWAYGIGELMSLSSACRPGRGPSNAT